MDGQDKVTRRAYNAHGEEAQVAGPRTDAATAEAAKTEWDYNTFGEATATRRRLPGRWLTSTTDYDAAGNKVGTAQPTGTGGVLESRYRYDNLNRLAAQTKDPSNPDHEVTYTYDGEGEQTTRTDLRQTAGPAAAACGESGVSTLPLSRSGSFTESSTGLRCGEGLVDGGPVCLSALEEHVDLVGEVVGGGPAELSGDHDGLVVSAEPDDPDASGGTLVVGCGFVVDLDGESTDWSA